MKHKEVGDKGELVALEHLLHSLSQKVTGYPYDLALLARLSALLEKRMAEAVNEALKPLGLTHVLYHVMMIIHGGDEGVVAPRVISHLTGERPNNVTHICNHLEGEGLLSRAHAAADRRRVDVMLTAAGRKLLARAQPLVWACWRKRFADIDAAQLAALPGLLKLQYHALDAAADETP